MVLSMLCGRDAGGVSLKQSAQGFAQDGHRAGNDHHRNHGHQQAVLHGGGTGLVFEEISVIFHACLHLKISGGRGKIVLGGSLVYN